MTEQFVDDGQTLHGVSDPDSCAFCGERVIGNIVGPRACMACAGNYAPWGREYLRRVSTMLATVPREEREEEPAPKVEDVPAQIVLTGCGPYHRIFLEAHRVEMSDELKRAEEPSEVASVLEDDTDPPLLISALHEFLAEGIPPGKRRKIAFAVNNDLDRQRALAWLDHHPAEPARVDPRPACISCGRRWVPREGEDATTSPCPGCAEPARAEDHGVATQTEDTLESELARIAEIAAKWRRTAKAAEAAIDQATADRDRARASRNQLREELVKANEELEIAKRLGNAVVGERDRAHADLEWERQYKRSLEVENARVKEQLVDVKEELAKANERIASVTADHDDLWRKAMSASKENGRLTEELVPLRHFKETHETECPRRVSIRRAEAEADEQAAKVRAAKARIDELATQLEEVRERDSGATHAMKLVQEDAMATKRENERLQTQLRGVHAETAELRRDDCAAIEQLTRDVLAKEKENARLAKELQVEREKIARARTEAAWHLNLASATTCPEDIGVRARLQEVAKALEPLFQAPTDSAAKGEEKRPAPTAEEDDLKEARRYLRQAVSEVHGPDVDALHDAVCCVVAHLERNEGRG